MDSGQVKTLYSTGHRASLESPTAYGSADSDTGTSLRCTQPGCSSRFSRKSALKRHIASKHRSHDGFECPAKDCHRAQHKILFRRADKLTQHVRYVHSADTFYECVETGCTKALARNDMFVHLYRHILGSATQATTTTKAVLNGLSPAFTRCPACATTVPLHQFCDHILQHSEIGFVYHELLQMNYLCRYLHYDHPARVHPGGKIRSVQSICVVCPVCGEQCHDHEEFYAHFVPSHVLRNAGHFESWISQVNAKLDSSGYSWISSKPDQSAAWRPWQLTLLSAGYIDLDILCPGCEFEEKLRRGGPLRHHMDILADYRHLVPHKYKILSLYPKFATHPLFQEEDDSPFDIIEVFRLRGPQSKLAEPTTLDLQLSSHDGLNPTGTQNASRHPVVTSNIPDEFMFLNDLDDDFFKANFDDSTGTKNMDDLNVMFDVDPSTDFNDIFANEDLVGLTNTTFNGGVFNSTNSDTPMLSGFGSQFELGFAIPWPGSEPETYHIRDDLSHDSSSLLARLDGLSACGTSPLPQQSIVSSPLHIAGSSSRTASAPHNLSSRSKAYTCDFCDRAYERRTELNHHRRSHTRPHVCDRCSRGFTDSRDLHRHIITHTRSKPEHACTFAACEKTFSRHDHLVRHRKDVHGQDPRTS